MKKLLVDTTDSLAEHTDTKAGSSKGILAYVLNWLDTPWCIAWGLGIGFVIRLGALAFLAELPLAMDAPGYHEVAVMLLRGEQFIPFWPPGLPYYLMFFYSLFGISELVARASMLLFYFAVSVGLYLLTRHIANRRAANLAVLLFALYPMHIYLSLDPLTQLPIAAGLVWLAYMLIRIQYTPTWVLLVALGVLLGIMALTRSNCFIFVLAAPIFIFFKTRKVVPALVPVLVALALIVPWQVKASGMAGRFIFINDANSKNLFIGNNAYTPLYSTWWLGSHFEGDPGVPDAYITLLNEIERQPPETHDQLYSQAALTHIIERPDLFVVRTLNRIRVYFAFDTHIGSLFINAYEMGRGFGLGVTAVNAMAFGLMMVLALGFLVTLRAGAISYEYLALLLGIALLYSLPFWVVFAHPRYNFPIMPLVVVLAAIFLERLLREPLRVTLEPFIQQTWRRYALLGGLGLFLLIQLEWTVVLYQTLTGQF